MSTSMYNTLLGPTSLKRSNTEDHHSKKSKISTDNRLTWANLCRYLPNTTAHTTLSEELQASQLQEKVCLWRLEVSLPTSTQKVYIEKEISESSELCDKLSDISHSNSTMLKFQQVIELAANGGDADMLQLILRRCQESVQLNQLCASVFGELLKRGLARAIHFNHINIVQTILEQPMFTKPPFNEALHYSLKTLLIITPIMQKAQNEALWLRLQQHFESMKKQMVDS